MNRPGTGPRGPGGMPGGMFSAQQTSNRGGPLNSGRLQNGNMGNGNNFGFGMPMGGAPGLTGAQSRNNPNMSSFAQTIGGGSQQHTPLDPSEFPSLSGAPQPQQANASAQAIWSNANLRQRTPLQRTPGQGAGAQGPTQPPQQPPQHQQSHEDGVPGSQYPGGVDDYRFGGQGGVGQLSGASQPKTGNIEEFPPLGGAGDGAHDRRTNMIQNAAYSNPVNGNAFAVGQGRNGALGPIDGQADGDGRRINHSEARNTPFQSQSSGADGQPDQSYPFDSADSPTAMQPRPDGRRLSGMTELERYGLPQLLSMIPNDSHDHSSLAIGQDLTVLGLDLTRPDDSPLYPTFATPFSGCTIRQPIPDFQLPPSYNVVNVPPLHTRMPQGGFSDDAVLAIFYQYPRDVRQELAAAELYNRDWRWHKELRQWMRKDPTLGAPTRISDRQERGYYVFWDATNWKRENRELLLNYDHLEQRHADTAHPA